ncbi:MAG TPA: hypothetical protein VNL77_20355 [Roseiflexaceae bacterium]|nr:hypothetical protein [Roseiflexaceae bacterium]
MRTTLDLEEDVLLAAKVIAQQWGILLGKVISDLVRQALTGPGSAATRNGVPLFPVRPGAGIVTEELVNQPRDEAS